MVFTSSNQKKGENLPSVKWSRKVKNQTKGIIMDETPTATNFNINDLTENSKNV